ncbi:MAG: cytochrome B [Nitrospiraceae bacterium]|nr:cytochrome B [Nitrospiraceae bacterium]|tara:strand:+ start:62 stop:646 length:585 start_codon:yes stop_codon:yes gene_type:complete
MFQDLAQWMLEWAGSPYAVWALFFIAVAESSFFPIPPDILLIALVLNDPDRGMYLATVTTAGSVIGGGIGYFIGFWGGRPILKRFVAENIIGRVQRQFDRYGGWAVGIAGFTPIPYKIFTIASGAFALKLSVFVVMSLAGRGGRFFAVAGSIKLFGAQMVELIERYFNIGSLVLIVVIAGSAFLVHLLRKAEPV